MNHTRIMLAAIALFCTAGFSTAQNINWRRFHDGQTHVINLNIGWDYGTSVGMSYGYKLNTAVPVVVNLECTFPFGTTALDDFKIKLGGQAEIFNSGGFAATVKANAIFRRYENDLARLLDFGSEFSGILGYYEPSWYIGAECGFDKAISTHVKNSAVMREYYPEVRDGWYVPTGGNFSYGIQTGYSLENYDIHLRIGKTVTQDFKTTPMIPYYLQLGLNRKF